MESKRVILPLGKFNGTLEGLIYRYEPRQQLVYPYYPGGGSLNTPAQDKQRARLQNQVFHWQNLKSHVASFYEGSNDRLSRYNNFIQITERSYNTTNPEEDFTDGQFSTLRAPLPFPNGFIIVAEFLTDIITVLFTDISQPEPAAPSDRFYLSMFKYSGEPVIPNLYLGTRATLAVPKVILGYPVTSWTNYQFYLYAVSAASERVSKIQYRKTRSSL